MPLTHNTDYLGQARSRYPAQYVGKPRFDVIVQSFASEAQQLEDAMWNVFVGRLLQNGTSQLIGRAVFNGTQTATLYWPRPFKDTSYLMLPGKPIVTDGGGPVATRIEGRYKTSVSVVVTSSALFTGYVPVLAWELGQNPIPTGGGGIGGDVLDKLGKIVGQPRNGMTDGEYLILITARIAANRSDGRRELLIRLAKLLVPGSAIYVKDFAPCSVLVFPQQPIGIDPYVAAQFMEIAKAAGVYIMFGWTTQPSNQTTLTLGYSVANGTTVPTTAQSPGWSGTGANAISGGLLNGIIAG